MSDPKFMRKAETSFQTTPPGATVAPAAGLLERAEKHLTDWLNIADCDCENGHYCGRTEVQKTRDDIRAAQSAPSTAPAGEVSPALDEALTALSFLRKAIDFTEGRKGICIYVPQAKEKADAVLAKYEGIPETIPPDAHPGAAAPAPVDTLKCYACMGLGYVAIDPVKGPIRCEADQHRAAQSAPSTAPARSKMWQNLAAQGAEDLANDLCGAQPGAAATGREVWVGFHPDSGKPVGVSDEPRFSYVRMVEARSPEAAGADKGREGKDPSPVPPAREAWVRFYGLSPQDAVFYLPDPPPIPTIGGEWVRMVEAASAPRSEAGE